jgi:hypothetical protein
MTKVRTTIAPGLTSDDFVQTGGGAKQVSTDGTLAGNSDSSVPTEKAVKTYVDAHAGGGSGTVTSVNVSGGSTGLTASGGPVTTSGTVTLAGTLAVASGGTGATTASNARSNLGFSTAAVQPVMYVPIHAAANSTLSWSAMPSAETMLNASTSRIQKLDLTNYTSVRLIAKVNTAGASGAKLIARYNTAGSVSSTISGNWTSDLGASEVSVAFGASTGMFDSGWISIAASAKGDYHVAVIGSGGDGSASPAFGGIQLQFR